LVLFGDVLLDETGVSDVYQLFIRLKKVDQFTLDGSFERWCYPVQQRINGFLVTYQNAVTVRNRFGYI
jgi:hypothetical protein